MAGHVALKFSTDTDVKMLVDLVNKFALILTFIKIKSQIIFKGKENQWVQLCESVHCTKMYSQSIERSEVILLWTSGISLTAAHDKKKMKIQNSKPGNRQMMRYTRSMCNREQW